MDVPFSSWKRSSNYLCIWCILLCGPDLDVSIYIHNNVQNHSLLSAFTKLAVTCQRCNHGEAYFKQMQIRSADEPMTTIYRCCKEECQHEWREDWSKHWLCYTTLPVLLQFWVLICPVAHVMLLLISVYSSTNFWKWLYSYTTASLFGC